MSVVALGNRSENRGIYRHMGNAKKTREQLEVGAFIADYLRRRTKQRGGTETYLEIAADVGLSGPHVSNVINGHDGATGPKIESAIAARLFGGSVDALRAAAKNGAPQTVTPSSRPLLQIQSLRRRSTSSVDGCPTRSSMASSMRKRRAGRESIARDSSRF